MALLLTSDIVHLLDTDQIGDQPELALQLRRVVVLDDLPDTAQAERPQRAAVALLRSDLGAHLRDAEPAHCSAPADAPTASVAGESSTQATTYMKGPELTASG